MVKIQKKILMLNNITILNSLNHVWPVLLLFNCKNILNNSQNSTKMFYMVMEIIDMINDCVFANQCVQIKKNIKPTKQYNMSILF